MRLPVLLVVAALGSIAVAAGPAAADTRPDTAAESPDHEAERLTVRLAPDDTAAARVETIVRSHGGAVVHRVEALDVLAVEVPASVAETLSTAVRSAGHADEVAPEVRYQAFDHMEPDDAFYGQQWALPVIGAPAAWDTTTGIPGTVIAVLDSGVDSSHPDLAPLLLEGYDFVDDDPVPEDRLGHGTHVAGVAAAAGDDGYGTAGVCWRCVIMPLKVLDDTGGGSETVVASGILGAVDRGADVVLMSFGGAHASSVVKSAVDHARSHGTVVVAAAGNTGSTDPVYPAAFDNVIGVTATDADDVAYPWSATGPWVDLAAPGCATGPLPGGGSGEECGTSYSAPLVAGAAGLVMSTSTAASADEVEDLLFTTAADVGPVVAHGRLDAGAALRSVEPSSVACPDPAFSPFEDIDRDSAHAESVACLADLRVSTGRSRFEYGSADRLRRDQLATLVARTVLTTSPYLPPTFDTFTGATGPVHEWGIDTVVALGISVGSVDGGFDPSGLVTRGQLATFVVRTVEAVTGNAPSSAGDAFPDDTDSVHHDAINRAAAAGLVTGFDEGRFDPTATVRRDQAASVLARTLEYVVEQGGE